MRASTARASRRADEPTRVIARAAAADAADHPLDQTVTEAFAGGGPLARADAGYVAREGQLAMAHAVAHAIAGREVLIAEAGTGIGKTYAYLVPALLSGARTLISTATKSLQDQLFLRDLPRLRDALAVPVKLALLKGRASYLCRHRLTQARQAATLPDRWAMRALARVERWALTTATGDLAEVDGLDEQSPVVGIVTSTRENCLGAECPEYRACHVMKARRDAMAADVVVVNHHLFFADLALRDSGVAELLPTVDVAIFDEAHQLSEAGVQFLGTTLGTGQLLDFARDVLAQGLAHARGVRPWADLANALEHAARQLRLAAAGDAAEGRTGVKLRWSERASAPAMAQALASCTQACSATAQALDAVEGAAPDLVKLVERSRHLAALAQRFTERPEPGTVRWIDLGAHQARLIESPLDIRDAMRQQIAAAPRAWIFTSATLGDDPRLSWFAESAGLEDAQVLRVDSPFDYPQRARLYVPSAFARPGTPEHAAAVADLALRCATTLGGRTFVLTTTLRALRSVGDRLREPLHEQGIEVLIQGTAPKRALMQQFRALARSVLVGSQSFWEGIDMPGDTLQCVIIDKLPFPPPNDPVVEARVERLQADGRNAFTDYFVAEAAVSLKQGAGRLIRTETDRGLLVVCDSRLAGMNYGRRLRNALPPMTRVASEDEAIAWLRELAAGHDGSATTAATTA